MSLSGTISGGSTGTFFPPACRLSAASAFVFVYVSFAHVLAVCGRCGDTGGLKLDARCDAGGQQICGGWREVVGSSACKMGEGDDARSDLSRFPVPSGFVMRIQLETVRVPVNPQARKLVDPVNAPS